MGLFAGGGSGGEGGTDGGSSSSVATLDGIRCHGLWLQYFTELWGALSDGSGTAQQAVLHRLFGRVLGHSLAEPRALSGHPAAAAARFQLLALALRYCRYELVWLRPHLSTPLDPPLPATYWR